MLTDKDIKKLVKVFATKEDLNLAIDKSFAKYKDEILTSNDKLNVKLDKILVEQKAVTVSYKRLEKRINYLEAVVKVLAEGQGVKFSPPEL